MHTGTPIAVNNVMTWLDMAIIYLACGAPFGVFQITKSSRPRSSSDIFVILAALVFWPAYALIFAAQSLFSDDARLRERRHKIEKLRQDLETALFGPDATAAAIFAYRDTFYRLVGLSEAASVGLSRGVHELFTITDHPNRILASTLTARRNRKKIVRHADGVRGELLDLIALSDWNQDEINGHVSEWASLIDDHNLAPEKRLGLPAAEPPAPRPDFARTK